MVWFDLKEFYKRYKEKRKTENGKVSEQKKDEALMPELPETDDFSKIKNSISRARQSPMNFDLEAAKKNYVEALKIYNNLKPQGQSKVYEELKELYFERKSAEDLKV